MANSNQDIETPDIFFNWVEKFLGIEFSVDLAANKLNTKCDLYYTKKQDSLKLSWNGYIGWGWLNPPYSNTEPWAEKCYAEAKKGARVVMLTPLKIAKRDSTTWDHANEVYLLEGRIWPEVRDCMLSVWYKEVRRKPQIIKKVSWKSVS